MGKLLITVGAITTASRFSRLMERKAGKRAAVVQTPSVLNSGGCSYSIQINENDLSEAKRISSEYRLPMRKIYRVDGGEYHVVS